MQQSRLIFLRQHKIEWQSLQVGRREVKFGSSSTSQLDEAKYIDCDDAKKFNDF